MPGPPLDVGALFEAHGARVLAFTHHLLGDRTDAEDATQETFLKAYRQADRFTGGCAPTTWLFAIARNTCLDRLRGRERRSFGRLESLITEASAAGEPVERAAADVAERRWYVASVREGCLLGTLGCLSPDQRAAFVLRVLCGMSTGDTALVLGRTGNAVRILTSRARQHLKTFLCRNCSLYQRGNRCRCENLVRFSLARGWITVDDRRVPRREAAEVAGRVARVVDGVAKLAEVYASLAEPDLDGAVVGRIRARLRALDAVSAAVTADPALEPADPSGPGLAEWAAK